MELYGRQGLHWLREFSFELFDGYVSYRFFPFENLRVGTTKDQIFVCDFTFEKCGSYGVVILFLGEGVEVVFSQQDGDLTGVGQLAVPRARPPLVWHYN